MPKGRRDGDSLWGEQRAAARRSPASAESEGDVGASPKQQHVLDLQRSAGNSAVVAERSLWGDVLEWAGGDVGSSRSLKAAGGDEPGTLKGLKAADGGGDASSLKASEGDVTSKDAGTPGAKDLKGYDGKGGTYEEGGSAKDLWSDGGAKDLKGYDGKGGTYEEGGSAKDLWSDGGAKDLTGYDGKGGTYEEGGTSKDAGYESGAKDLWGGGGDAGWSGGETSESESSEEAGAGAGAGYAGGEDGTFKDAETVNIN